MAATAHLEVRVDSSGVRAAGKDLRDLTSYSKDTEKQNHRLADTFAEIAAAEEKEAKKAVAIANAKAKAANDAAKAAEESAKKQADIAARQSQKENERWNDLKQKALAKYEAEAQAAEKSAKRKTDAAEKAAKKEAEIWNDQIQKSKARAEREGWGKDGVLPIRPSLQRIEAKINATPSVSAGIGAGEAGALGALGGSLANALPMIGAATVSMAGLHKVIAETSAYDGLIARLAGVTGGADAAREKFDKLEQLSDRTIYTENQVTEAFIRMEQNGLKPTEQTLSAFANIASATGSSIEELAEASLAASLGNYKGLRQFGIKAVQEGEGIKVTFKGVSTTIGNSADDITRYLVGIGETDFSGAAERQLDTMGGSVKKLENAWGDMFREVGRSAVGDFIATGMKEAAKAVDFTTQAFEALLFTMSQKPKFTGMSVDLANFAKGAAKWGAPKSDEELSLADKVQSAIDHLNKGLQSAKDLALAEYEARKRVLEEGLSVGVPGDLAAALDENRRQYEEAAGAGMQTTNTKKTVKDAGSYSDIAYRAAAEKNAALRQEVADYEAAQEDEYAATVAYLLKEEDAEKASYNRRRQVLEANLGPDTEAALAANEALWVAHNEKIAADLDAKAEKNAMAQLALQHKLASIGVGPQSTMQAINTKTAGAYFELDSALADNRSGKNGKALKLQAEEQYAEKSIAIEKHRIREIKEANQELVKQSVNNSELLFGNLAEAAKNAGGEQSKAYQFMFAAQKAFAVASAATSMAVGMGKAMELGWPAGIPAGIAAAAEGAKIMAMITSQSYSGAHDAGGDIQSGSYGDVGERRQELLLVHGRSRVQGPATVIGGEATAALLGGGGKQQSPNLQVNLGFDLHGEIDRYMSSTRGTRTLNLHAAKNQRIIQAMGGR